MFCRHTYLCAMNALYGHSHHCEVNCGLLVCGNILAENRNTFLFADLKAHNLADFAAIFTYLLAPYVQSLSNYNRIFIEN